MSGRELELQQERVEDCLTFTMQPVCLAEDHFHRCEVGKTAGQHGVRQMAAFLFVLLVLAAEV